LRHPFLQVNDNAATVDVERGQVGVESIFPKNLSVHRLTKRASIRPRSNFHQRKSLWVNDFHPTKPDGAGDRNPNTRNERGISLALCQLPKLLKVDGHLLSPPFATR
jgi:Cu2+-containing amine oxidase